LLDETNAQTAEKAIAEIRTISEPTTQAVDAFPVPWYLLGSDLCQRCVRGVTARTLGIEFPLLVEVTFGVLGQTDIEAEC